jgi:hypothetical protein
LEEELCRRRKHAETLRPEYVYVLRESRRKPVRAGEAGRRVRFDDKDYD